MFWNNNKKKEVLDMIDRLDRESDKKRFEMVQPVYSWFINSINTESRIIVEQGGMPSKLFLKYPITYRQENNMMFAFMSNFGQLQVIVDPDMKEILRVE